MSELNKTKTIRVSEETIKILGKERQGFETPDQCLQRILSDQNSKQNEKKSENVSHTPYYDSLGNYFTYDEDRDTWVAHIDSKNLSISE